MHWRFCIDFTLDYWISFRYSKLDGDNLTMTFYKDPISTSEPKILIEDKLSYSDPKFFDKAKELAEKCVKLFLEDIDKKEK